VDWSAPSGIEMAEIDKTTGGLMTPQCPPITIANAAFKTGTAPTQPCPLHQPQAPPPPAVDQFGNPIALDTSGVTTTSELPSMPTDTTGTQLPPPPPLQPPQPQPPPPETDTSSTTTTTSTQPPPSTTSTQ
ncbi:MAG TPA: hypothetical protein VJ901_02275, partial [Thermoanaerobaculia bacterium]|nr:hypothetical protein [Thermoanaerobaculia bacterium]